MKRGDLVTVALQVDLGKPRPALVIQSDYFNVHPSVVILPITSELRDAPLFWILMNPDAENGLSKPSQIMVDKPQSVAREKIGSVFGCLDEVTLFAVNQALALFLGL